MSTLGDDGDGIGGDGGGGGGGGGGKGVRDGRPPPPPPKRVKPAGGADGGDGQAEWELPGGDQDAPPPGDGQGAGAGAGAAADEPAGPPAPHKYLVMPGNYSGDSWHIAAAMLLDPTIRVVIPTKAAGDFDAITNQTIAFLRAAGIAEDRILRDNSLSRYQMVSQGQAAAAARDVIERVEAAGANPVTGWTFASTSVIADAIANLGAAAVQQQLRAGFAADPGDGRYDAALATIAAAQPCVIINMRRGVGGNHPQHNITQEILDQICARAQAAHLNVVRVGGYQDERNTPGAQWMRDLDPARYGPVVEIFPAGQRVDRRATAYFWSRVQALQAAGQVSGIIGGRSGSLDVAAFMGLRTFCWDIQNAGDHEYARLCVARALMSIGQRADRADHRTDPSGALDQGEIDRWLAGQVIAPHLAPNGDFDRVCRLNQLTGARSAEHRQALLMTEPVAEEEEEAGGDEDDDPQGDQGGDGDEHDGGGDGDEQGDRRPHGDAPGGAGLMFGAPAPLGAPSDAHLQAMALLRAFAPPPAPVPLSAVAPMDGVMQDPPPAPGPPRGRDRSRAVNTNSLRERSDRSRSPVRAPDGAGGSRERERSRRRRSRSGSPA